MNTLVYVIIICAVAVFFKQELDRLFQRFEQFPAFNLILLLFILSYLNLSYFSSIRSFFQIVSYDLAMLSRQFFKLLSFVHISSQNQYVFKYLFRLTIFILCLYYPEAYRRRYPSQIYAAQVFSVRAVFYIMMVLLLMIFAVINM